MMRLKRCRNKKKDDDNVKEREREERKKMMKTVEVQTNLTIMKTVETQTNVQAEQAFPSLMSLCINVLPFKIRQIKETEAKETFLTEQVENTKIEKEALMEQITYLDTQLNMQTKLSNIEIGELKAKTNETISSLFDQIYVLRDENLKLKNLSIRVSFPSRVPKLSVLCNDVLKENKKKEKNEIQGFYNTVFQLNEENERLTYINREIKNENTKIVEENNLLKKEIEILKIAFKGAGQKQQTRDKKPRS